MGIRSSARSSSRVQRLSAREGEVALLISQAGTNRDIACALGISEKTVEHHISAIFHKLGLRSRTQLVVQYLTLRDALRPKRR
jgi:DNA-binding CsgD family transcriptional regulator